MQRVVRLCWLIVTEISLVNLHRRLATHRMMHLAHPWRKTAHLAVRHNSYKKVDFYVIFNFQIFLLRLVD